MMPNPTSPHHNPMPEPRLCFRFMLPPWCFRFSISGCQMKDRATAFSMDVAACEHEIGRLHKH